MLRSPKLTVRQELCVAWPITCLPFTTWPHTLHVAMGKSTIMWRKIVVRPVQRTCSFHRTVSLGVNGVWVYAQTWCGQEGRNGEPLLHLFKKTANYLLLLTKLGSATFEASRALVAAPVYDALILRWLCRPNASHLCFCKGVINGYIQLLFRAHFSRQYNKRQAGCIVYCKLACTHQKHKTARREKLNLHARCAYLYKWLYVYIYRNIYLYI